jgi:hypothetical protein
MMLDKRDQNGGSRRRDLLQASRQTGAWYPELDTPPIPFEMWIEWSWFTQLNARRDSGMGGPSPISYSEIEAWMRYTGTVPNALQRRLLADLDVVFLNVYAEVNDG